VANFMNDKTRYFEPDFQPPESFKRAFMIDWSRKIYIDRFYSLKSWRGTYRWIRALLLYTYFQADLATAVNCFLSCFQYHSVSLGLVGF
jgi:hypothetical protein